MITYIPWQNMLALHIFQNTTGNDDDKGLNRSYPAFHGKHALEVERGWGAILKPFQ
jgi:hypothetical protein